MTFTGQQFGFSLLRKNGIVGELQWHPVRQDPQMVADAVDQALDILGNNTCRQSRLPFLSAIGF